MNKNNNYDKVVGFTNPTALSRQQRHSKKAALLSLSAAMPLHR